MPDLSFSPGAVVSPALRWLNINHHGFFEVISRVIQAVVEALNRALLFAPGLITIAVLSVLALVSAGRRTAAMVLAGGLLCYVLGMWKATAETLSLVVIATAISLTVGIAAGILVSRSRKLQAVVRPLLDIMQTLPPWVYIVPAVVLFGLGVVPAMLATVFYGIAPMLRLSMVALAQVQPERIELGRALGATKRKVLWAIEIPSAMPLLLVGVNQCILLSLSMVVLAGLVGAGGLGAEVTRGLTRMEMGLGFRAGLAIVVVAIVLDRVCRAAVPRIYHGEG